MTTPETMGICQYSRCDRKLISAGPWNRASQEERDAWAAAGFWFHGSHGFCSGHAKQTYPEFADARDAIRTAKAARASRVTHRSAQEVNEERMQEAARRRRFVVGKYRGLVREGFRDPLAEIAHQTSLPIPSIQRMLQREGVAYERRQPLALKRAEVIEEVTFFRMMGRGVKEICDALHMTPERLSESLRHWKTDGFHDLDLEWLDGHLMMDYRNGYGDVKWK